MSGRVQPCVMIMAGGTGGHIFPGLAVAEVLRGRGYRVEWLGARGGMEASRVPAADFRLHEVDIRGLRGKGLAGWLALPWRLGRAVGQAGRVIAEVRPGCAISFGGYVAGPGGLAAWLRGVPLLVHEQNRIPGLTNRVLSRVARAVLQAFADSFPARRGARTVGNPVRESVCALPSPEERFAHREGAPRLLVTGGSQGARILNELLPAALARLPADARPRVRHQAGRGRGGEVRAAYAEAGVEAEVSAFIDDMAAAYGEADLVVCRSGALTVSELAVAGLGAVLVPFPHAVDDHQARNAEVLVAAGAAVMLREEGLDAAKLATVLEELLGDRDRLADMARGARTVGVPDAAEQVADACAGWLEEGAAA